MNGIYGTESEAYDEAYDESSDEAFDEAYDEARRRRPVFRPVGTAARGSAFQARPSMSPVTQAQLQAALARVSQQINLNSTAIKTVDGRTRGLAVEQAKFAAGLKKEFGDRKKDILAVRKDLQATREAGVLLPILGLLAPGSPIAAFAPLLLLGNDVSADPLAPGAVPASGGLLGGLGGGGGSTGLIALLALSGAIGR
jgi:hypothetical protein